MIIPPEHKRCLVKPDDDVYIAGVEDGREPAPLFA